MNLLHALRWEAASAQHRDKLHDTFCNRWSRVVLRCVSVYSMRETSAYYWRMECWLATFLDSGNFWLLLTQGQSQPYLISCTSEDGLAFSTTPFGESWTARNLSTACLAFDPAAETLGPAAQAKPAQVNASGGSKMEASQSAAGFLSAVAMAVLANFWPLGKMTVLTLQQCRCMDLNVSVCWVWFSFNEEAERLKGSVASFL